MKRRVAVYVMCAAIFLSLFSSCFNKNKVNSSGESQSIKTVIGNADESIEYPNSDSSISFSDVSVPLSSFDSATSSNSSSVSSKKVQTSSSKTSSPASSSKVATSSKISGVTVSLAASSSSGGSKLNYSKVKGLWISYVDFGNIMTGRNESQFRQNFEKVCKNSVGFGINTLFCQVRAFGDAAYQSDYFAWASMVSGIGVNQNYDPLKIMIEIAHKYKLSVHAWLNPYRAYLSTDVSKVPSTSVFKKWYNDRSKKGISVVECGGRWYFNPGEPEVTTLVKNGVMEIVNKYNVDGIHFDDYFYPTVSASFDSKSYAKYGSGMTLANWRISNVSNMVKAVYSAVKSKNQGILFGISPQASVDNDYNQLYADVKTWGKQNGYVDYLCPQIYFSYKSETLNFTTALATWEKLVTASGVSLFVGISPYRIGYYDTWACKDKTHTVATASCGKFGWQTSTPSTSNILASQVRDSFAVSKCKGIILFSYNYVFNIDAYFKSSSYSVNAVEQAKVEMAKLKEALK